MYGAIRVLNEYKGKAFEGDSLLEYHYMVAEQKRELKLVFESVSPFKIVGFIARYPSAFK